MLHAGINIMLSDCTIKINYDSVFVFPVRYAETGGVAYERWGRTDCPSGAEEVYSGFIGGAWYDDYGNGAEYICLPEDPVYVEQSTIAAQYQAWIYSTEYRTNDLGFSTPTQYYDAPCVVCHVPRSAKIMIPAHTACPTSWTTEYTGYLMSTAYGNINNKNYVCVDMNAKTMLGSEANTQGALLYFVTANCDNSFMPCLPYVQNTPLTCVVCTM